MLLSLVNHSPLRGFNKVMSKPEEHANQLSQYLLDQAEGVNYLVSEFNFDKCIDLMKLLPEVNFEHFEMLMALFKASRKNKRFWEGRKPTYDDVQVIINRVKDLKLSHSVDETALSQLQEIARFVLQKAITSMDHHHLIDHKQE